MMIRAHTLSRIGTPPRDDPRATFFVSLLPGGGVFVKTRKVFVSFVGDQKFLRFCHFCAAARKISPIWCAEKQIVLFWPN